MRRTAALLLLLLLASAAPAAAQDPQLEQAIAQAGALSPPTAELGTPVGRLGLAQAELLAARPDQPIRITLTLDRAVARGSVHLAIPARWRTVPESGLRPSTAPRQRGRAAGARVGAATASADLVLDGARAGTAVTAEIRDTGIPAGTYDLPVSYTDGSGRTRPVGRLQVRLYAPAREAAETPFDFRAVDVTNAPGDQSESFITVVPGNPNRVLVGGNGGSSGYSAWISSNGGTSWTEQVIPVTADDAGTSTNVTLNPCCDPMSAADAAGNIWYGGLGLNPGPKRIHVSRIAAGTTTFVDTVALRARTSGTQDKPMMTIDNNPSSPGFGRLYVVWDEPSAGVNLVMTTCNTRPGGVLNAANCDNADNWTVPVSVTKATGSYIYADVATGPDGKVYVVWWNYSSANAIQGATCAGPPCSTVTSWTAGSDIATLDSTGGTPVPFACPIMAQPGGRASTGSNVEVDNSPTATAGRVWVAWSDLRAGSGTTRCADGDPPSPTHLTWDSLAKSAVNALPTTAATPTRLLTDGEGGGQANSDDWFPWITVDQTTGRAYADFYSTRDDLTRRTTQFYARSINAAGALGSLTRVSTVESDYSTRPCCTFGNDYGDYTGIDATSGFAYPVWSGTSGLDGEILMSKVTLPPPNRSPTAVISGPSTATVGESVTLSAAGSSDPDGTIDHYDWDLDGNGSLETTTTTPSASTSFPAAGTYAVQLRAIDNSHAVSPVVQTSIAVSAGAGGGGGGGAPAPTVAPPLTGPDPPAATEAPPLTGPDPVAALLHNGASIKAVKGVFSAPLAGCAQCVVVLELKTAKKVAVKAGAKRKVVRMARVKKTLDASGRATARFKLSKVNAALLKRLRKIPLKATLTVTNPAGQTGTSTGKLTLKR